MHEVDEQRVKNLYNSLEKCSTIQDKLHVQIMNASHQYLHIGNSHDLEHSHNPEHSHDGDNEICAPQDMSIIVQVPEPISSGISYDLRLSPTCIQRMMRDLTEESQPTIDEILVTNPTLKGFFHGFLRESYCDENMDFYEDVLEYTKITDLEQRRRRATEICDVYIAQDAPRMVNLHSDSFAYIEKHRHLSDQQLFYDAQKEVYKLMTSDSLPKFIGSQNYLEYLLRISE
eukprot:TRINITY_DN1086_c0_g1_i1.p1 TRINITY_DN1086_c0_g1~~TRINITY_DN1086_c0_g1_i1.p1  ORF type:complete len:230 (-),score=25.30 TRINITY_DN1086_c0_g1_i1:121-810(-)